MRTSSAQRRTLGLPLGLFFLAACLLGALYLIFGFGEDQQPSTIKVNQPGPAPHAAHADNSRFTEEGYAVASSGDPDVEEARAVTDAALPDDAIAEKGDQARSDLDERRRAERQRREQRWRDDQRRRSYDYVMNQLFGDLPSDPVAALGQLDDDTLLQLLDSHAGDGVGSDFATAFGRQWGPERGLEFLEGLTAFDTLQGQVASRLLRGWLRRTRQEIRADDRLARRVLRVFDEFLESWRGKPVHHTARMDLIRGFDTLSPVGGGLDFIRKWVVETPHGDEVIEMQLVRALRHWPLHDARELALTALATLRAGPVKGVVRIWHDTSRHNFSHWWSEQELRRTFEIPLAEALVATREPSGIVLALALASNDLLAGQLRYIADGLIDRRDCPVCASQGIAFLKRVDVAAAKQVFDSWMYSGDSFLNAAACLAVRHDSFKNAAHRRFILDRVQQLAVSRQSSPEVWYAAGGALATVDASGRGLELVATWLEQARLPDEKLEPVGRIVARAELASVRSTLGALLDDPVRSAEFLHLPLVLLAMKDWNTAVARVEADLDTHQRRYADETVLLVAAIAESVLINDNAMRSRTAAIRERVAMPEPEWIRALRHRQVGPEPNTIEHLTSRLWLNR